MMIFNGDPNTLPHQTSGGHDQNLTGLTTMVDWNTYVRQNTSRVVPLQ